MTSRKQPGVAFWATVVVVVALVAYPLSFGPACWLASRGYVPEGVLAALYEPLIFVAVDPLNGDTNILWDALWWWATICGGEDALSIMLFV